MLNHLIIPFFFFQPNWLRAWKLPFFGLHAMPPLLWESKIASRYLHYFILVISNYNLSSLLQSTPRFFILALYSVKNNVYVFYLLKFGFTCCYSFSLCLIPKSGVLGGTRSYPTEFCLFVQFSLWSNSEFRLGPGQLLLQSLVSLCLGQAL